MADPFRVEPQGKSWADIVEEDEELDHLNSQDEESVQETKEAKEETDATSALNALSIETNDSKNLNDTTTQTLVQPEPNQVENKQSESTENPQKDNAQQHVKPQDEPTKQEEKPVLVGSSASKWASAPSEPPRQSKWQSTSSTPSQTTSTSKESSGLFESGAKASKWASAPDEPRSKYDNNNSRYGNHDRNDNNSRYGNHDRYDNNGRYGKQDRYDNNGRYGNQDRYGNNNNFRRNKRWQEDAPTGGRLNRSAFEDVPTGGRLNRSTFEDNNSNNDARNGGFDNKANFSRERRYQEYESLTNKEENETPETKKAIESWNAYKPPAEENEETAKQLVTAVNDAVPEINDQQIETESPKAPEPVATTAATVTIKSLSPSLAPTSSFSWADDIPGENDDDDIEDYIPTDWIKPKATELKEADVPTQDAVNENKESTIDHSPAKVDEEAAVSAWNSMTQEATTEPVKSWNDESAVEQQPAPSLPEKETPTYAWRALNDYKEPEIIIPKSEDIPKLGKEQEDAAIAAWQSAKLPEVPETEIPATYTIQATGTTSDIASEVPSWNQSFVEQPFWSQSTIEQPSWEPHTANNESQSFEEVKQPEPASESKPTYTWGALNDYKESEVIPKPKSEVIHLTKEDEEAAVSAWNAIKLPEEPEQKQEQEPLDETPSWTSEVKEPEPVAAVPSWTEVPQETTTIESSWNTVQQPTWSEPSTAVESANEQSQDWNDSSFQDTSSFSGRTKSSIKDTWKNKLPTNIEDNAGGWKSFVKTATVVAPKETATVTKKTVSASPLVQPTPQNKPHELSFNLNDLKEANNEVHINIRDIQNQEKQSVSINDTESDRTMTVNFTGLSSTKLADPTKEIALRLSDLTGWQNPEQQQQQQQQHLQPEKKELPEVFLSFSELNKNRKPAASSSTTEVSLKLSEISPSSSTTKQPQGGANEVVYKPSDFNKGNADEPMEVTLKLW